MGSGVARQEEMPQRGDLFVVGLCIAWFVVGETELERLENESFGTCLKHDFERHTYRILLRHLGYSS